MLGWYIAKSKPQKEAWLEASLTQLGVEVFYPRITARRRGKRVLEPLFPTYLFCRFAFDEVNWPAMHWAPGLNYFLSVDGVPSRVPDDMLNLIRKGVDSWNDGKATGQHLNPGDSVIVNNGPFTSLEGIFQGYVPSRKRCKILLHVVGRLTAVEIGEDDLVMATPKL